MVADAQMEVEEMLCESYSQRIGKFHQNEIVLTICHLSSLIDNHIEEGQGLNMDAVKTEYFQRDIQEEPRGPISGLILPEIDFTLFDMGG